MLPGFKIPDTGRSCWIAWLESYPAQRPPAVPKGRVTTTCARATTACERSRTTPRMDPVTSARSALAQASVIKTIEITKTTRRSRWSIGHPHLARSLRRSPVEVNRQPYQTLTLPCLFKVTFLWLTRSAAFFVRMVRQFLFAQTEECPAKATG